MNHFLSMLSGHQRAVPAQKKVGEGVNGFPGHIQAQGKKRHRIGFLFESQADALFIHQNPAEAAEDRKKGFHIHFQVNRANFANFAPTSR